MPYQLIELFLIPLPAHTCSVWPAYTQLTASSSQEPKPRASLCAQMAPAAGFVQADTGAVYFLSRQKGFKSSSLEIRQGIYSLQAQ